MDYMDERTREFTDAVNMINAEAGGLGYKTGIDWAEKAGVLGASDAGSYKGAHYLRNAVAHGRAKDVRVTQETLDFVNAILLTIQATTQASNASNSRRAFFKKLFGNEKDDLPDAQKPLDVDDRTHEFLNVIEVINAEAGGLGYRTGIDWAENAGVLGAGDASNFRSCHYLRLAAMHGRAKDVHVTQETLDFVLDILQAIQEAGQIAETSKPRTAFFHKLFNKKQADRPAAESAEVPRKPEPKPEAKPAPKPDTLEWYLQKAEKGDASAQFELGRRYCQGEGVDEDKAAGLNWCRKAAQQGHMDAQLLLGEWYENGTNVTMDKAEALKWYLMAEENGCEEVVLKLASWYEKGIGTLADRGAACKWYTKAAEKGNADAQLFLAKYYALFSNKEAALKYYRMAAEQGCAEAQAALGSWYEEGVGVRKDREEAIRWYLQAAEQGYVDAQCALGRLYWVKGYAYRTDSAKWYRIAAEQGHPAAQYGLAGCYENGYATGVADRQEAIKWYLKAAEQGRSDAQYRLGMLYQSSRSEESLQWLIKSAEQGYLEAQLELGSCYDEGYWAPQDIQQARKWYQKAAAQGDRDAMDWLADNPEKPPKTAPKTAPKSVFSDLAEAGDAYAQYKLGCEYLNGRTMPKDAEKAAEWFTKAAKQDQMDAVYMLARCYDRGWGVEQDEDTAVKLYKIAAGEEQADAEYELGRCFELGRGVRKDMDSAIMWYEDAAEHGSWDAEERLKELRDEEDF